MMNEMEGGDNESCHYCKTKDTCLCKNKFMVGK